MVRPEILLTRASWRSFEQRTAKSLIILCNVNSRRYFLRSLSFFPLRLPLLSFLRSLIVVLIKETTLRRDYWKKIVTLCPCSTWTLRNDPKGRNECRYYNRWLSESSFALVPRSRRNLWADSLPPVDRYPVASISLLFLPVYTSAGVCPVGLFNYEQSNSLIWNYTFPGSVSFNLPLFYVILNSWILFP